MINAIVYQSKTGHTKKYAEILSTKLKLPILDIQEAKTKLKKGDEIIYLGWVCASKIMGLNKALRKYKVICCGAVGAYPKIEENIQDLIKANNLEIPLFYMQGGIDYSKLNKLYKKLLQAIGKTIENINDNVDKQIVEMFEKGKDFVCEENIKELADYIENNRTK